MTLILHGKTKILGPEHIAQQIGDKGIFLGEWGPTSRSGKRLGMILNVFVDLKDTISKLVEAPSLSFQTTSRKLASIGKKSPLYNKCLLVDNEALLYIGFKNGDLLGKPIIPPRELIDGKNFMDDVVRAKYNLYELRNTGAFKGTFSTECPPSSYKCCYRSCTPPQENPNLAFYVNFKTGKANVLNKRNCELRTRFCRVELAP